MKYLAVLRDSFRESLDSKILYVTLGLSALVILLIGSISIRKLTMEEELNARARLMQLLFSAQQRDLKVVVEDYKQTNDAAQPWNGNYEFTFVLRVPTAGNENLGGLRSLINDQVAQHLAPAVEAFFWRLNITSIRPVRGPINEFRLKVVSKGTKVTRAEDWPHEPVLFFGALPATWLISSPASLVYFIENNLVNSITGWVIVLLGIIATASFVPNMLRKGSVDLLLSKPVSRVQLLVFKFLGGLTFLFLSAGVVIVAAWIIVGLRSGIWAWGFLLTIPLLTFYFAILYSVSVLAAMLTRSTVVSILLTCLAWFLLWLVGLIYGYVFPEPILPDTVEAKMESAQGRSQRSSEGLNLPEWASSTVDALYHILPRTRDLGKLTARLLSHDLLSEEERRADGLERPPRTSWAEALGVSAAWIAVLLGLSCWVFIRRDY